MEALERPPPSSSGGPVWVELRPALQPAWCSPDQEAQALRQGLLELVLAATAGASGEGDGEQQARSVAIVQQQIVTLVCEYGMMICVMCVMCV